MPHGILHGTKHGDVHGTKHNVLVLGGGVQGVSRDSTSNIYAPTNSTEWTNLMLAAGLSSGNPASTWLCQEASGQLNDVISTVHMGVQGTGHLYQQTITGWTRKAVKTVDGTVGQRWLNNTNAPNPNTTDVTMLVYLNMPAASPAAVRDVHMVSNTGDVRFNTTGKLRLISGASNDLVQDPRNRTMPIVLKIDNTNSVIALYTDQEKFIGTYTLPASAVAIALGGQTASAADIGYLYAAQFTNAAARLTDANVKTLLQTLGWTVPWT